MRRRRVSLAFQCCAVCVVCTTSQDLPENIGGDENMVPPPLDLPTPVQMPPASRLATCEGLIGFLKGLDMSRCSDSALLIDFLEKKGYSDGEIRDAAIQACVDLNAPRRGD